MTQDITNRLAALNGERSTQGNSARLIPAYILDEHGEEVRVFSVTEDVWRAFEQHEDQFLEVSEDRIIFDPSLTYDERNDLLMDVVRTVDNDPSIIREEKSAYAIDGQTRPIGGDNPLTNPLLMISRPYCRDGFQCQTHFVTAIIQRENGEILLQHRAKAIEGANPNIDNYLNKMDLSIGAAHVRNENDDFIAGWEADKSSATRAIFGTLNTKGPKEVGLDFQDLGDKAEVHYLGSTEFSWANSDKGTFQNEVHAAFHISVPNDWQPKNNDKDVEGFNWVSPDEFVEYVLMPEQYSQSAEANGDQKASIQDFEFNDNNLAVAIRTMVQMDLIHEHKLGTELFNTVMKYDQTHRPAIDPITAEMGVYTPGAPSLAPDLG